MPSFDPLASVRDFLALPGIFLLLLLLLQKALAFLPAKGFYCTHSRQFRIDVFFGFRDFMRLFGRGPESGDGKSFFEICAKVIHPPDGEEDIHSKL